MNGSKILVIGLAYKPDVDDMRESPTFKIFDLLKAKGAKVSYYDPFIPKVLPTREHADWTGTQSVTWNKDTVSRFDAVVISTNHTDIDYQELAEWSDCVIDARNAMNGIAPKNNKHIFQA